MNPITWRSVASPNFSAINSILDSAQRSKSEAFDTLGKRFAGETQTNISNWDNTAKNNTEKFYADVASQFKTPEEYQAALKSGLVEQMRQQYGAQIDQTGVRKYLEERPTVLMDRLTKEQTYTDAQTDRGQREYINGFKQAIAAASTPEELATLRQGLNTYGSLGHINSVAAANLVDQAVNRERTLASDKLEADKAQGQLDHWKASARNQQAELILRRAEMDERRNERFRQQAIAKQEADAKTLTAVNGSHEAYLKNAPEANTLKMAGKNFADDVAKATGVDVGKVQKYLADLEANPIQIPKYTQLDGKWVRTNEYEKYDPSQQQVIAAIRAHGDDFFFAKGDIRGYIQNQMSDPTVAARVADARSGYANLWKNDNAATPTDTSKGRLPADTSGQNKPATNSATSGSAAATTTPPNQTASSGSWAENKINTPLNIQIKNLESSAAKLEQAIAKRTTDKDTLVRQFGPKMYDQRMGLDQAKLSETQQQIAALRAQLVTPETAAKAVATTAPAAPVATTALDKAQQKASSAVPATGTLKGDSVEFQNGNFLMRGNRGVGLEPVYGQGTKVKVEDGDTVYVTNGGKTQKIRLFNVDAPETDKGQGGQRYSKESKDFITKMMASGKVEIVVTQNQTDKHGRRVGEVFVDGKSVNEALVENGLVSVLDMKDGSMNPHQLRRLRELEDSAIRKRLGMYSGDLLPTSAALFRKIGQEL